MPSILDPRINSKDSVPARSNRNIKHCHAAKESIVSSDIASTSIVSISMTRTSTREKFIKVRRQVWAKHYSAIISREVWMKKYINHKLSPSGWEYRTHPHSLRKSQTRHFRIYTFNDCRQIQTLKELKHDNIKQCMNSLRCGSNSLQGREQANTTVQYNVHTWSNTQHVTARNNGNTIRTSRKWAPQRLQRKRTAPDGRKPSSGRNSRETWR